jgi:hypothetical protein
MLRYREPIERSPTLPARIVAIHSVRARLPGSASRCLNPMPQRRSVRPGKRLADGHRIRRPCHRLVAACTTEEQWYQTPGYKVAGKGFLRLRTEAEGGLVVFVSDMGEKQALLTSNPDAFFTTSHYDGSPHRAGESGQD